MKHWNTWHRISDICHGPPLTNRRRGPDANNSSSRNDSLIWMCSTKKRQQFQSNATMNDDESLQIPVEEMQNMLFQALSKFIRTVPPKSKHIIWKHALQTDLDEDDQKICSVTNSDADVAKLLAVCTTVYVKVLTLRSHSVSTSIWLCLLLSLSLCLCLVVSGWIGINRRFQSKRWCRMFCIVRCSSTRRSARWNGKSLKMTRSIWRRCWKNMLNRMDHRRQPMRPTPHCRQSMATKTAARRHWVNRKWIPTPKSGDRGISREGVCYYALSRYIQCCWWWTDSLIVCVVFK